MAPKTKVHHPFLFASLPTDRSYTAKKSILTSHLVQSLNLIFQSEITLYSGDTSTLCEKNKILGVNPEVNESRLIFLVVCICIFHLGKAESLHERLHEIQRQKERERERFCNRCLNIGNLFLTDGKSFVQSPPLLTEGKPKKQKQQFT